MIIRGDIAVNKANTEENPTDMMTKLLSTTKFEY